MVKWISEEKWQARIEKRETNLGMMPDELRPIKKNNLCKKMPREMAHYINLSRSICTECKVPNSTEHLLYKHGIQIPNWEELVTQIQTKQIKESMRRRQGIELARSEVKINLSKYREAIEGITNRDVNKTKYINNS